MSFNYGTSPYRGTSHAETTYVPEILPDTPSQFVRFFQSIDDAPDGFGVVAHRDTGVMQQPTGADPVELWECHVIPIRKVQS
jgi:hypothetical protein